MKLLRLTASAVARHSLTNSSTLLALMIWLTFCNPFEPKNSLYASATGIVKSSYNQSLMLFICPILQTSCLRASYFCQNLLRPSGKLLCLRIWYIRRTFVQQRFHKHTFRQLWHQFSHWLTHIATKVRTSTSYITFQDHHSRRTQSNRPQRWSLFHFGWLYHALK